jgi:hypothetical protein
MAKELPYFKFEPAQWDNGKIQFCDDDIKGIFIEMCCMYWQRLGDLPHALALQKHCKGNPTAIDMLKKFDVIDIIEGQIIIEFLDEQLNEFQETSEKRSKAANKRWKNASAMQKQCKSNAIREEKKREEERREEKKEVVFPFDSIEFKKNWQIWKNYKKTDHRFSYKSEVSEQAALKSLNELSKGVEENAIKIIHQSIAGGWKGFFELKNNNNGNTSRKENISEARQAIRDYAFSRPDL